MNSYDPNAARLFAEGADARLRGEPKWSCYDRYDSHSLQWWLRGWIDVNSHWGKHVAGRWYCRALPPVREDVPAVHEYAGGEA